MRIAAAPISWGVCEVPGWGFQLAPERVLTEMRQLGIEATEFGPDGFLPEAPDQKAKVLASHGLKAVGGFVPVVLHQAEQDPVPQVDQALDGFVAAGGDCLVLAANSGLDGYDAKPELTADQWQVLFNNLDRLAELAYRRGITASLHPHVGTMVETRDEVYRVLEGSSMPLTLDTGHLLIGGTDPVELARQHADRIAHVHAKDVNATKADQVRSGAVPYQQAVANGLYVPLGEGDVDFQTIVNQLAKAGFDGWFVMEQDTILTAEPEDEGPVKDVRTSIEYLKSLAR